jgi:hypothetical protein
MRVAENTILGIPVNKGKREPTSRRGYGPVSSAKARRVA